MRHLIIRRVFVSALVVILLSTPHEVSFAIFVILIRLSIIALIFSLPFAFAISFLCHFQVILGIVCLTPPKIRPQGHYFRYHFDSFDKLLLGCSVLLV